MFMERVIVNENLSMYTHSVKDAVILAAGQGSRLGAGLPKCLRTVGGHSLLEHQIYSLRYFGIERILVVIGSEAECVRASLAGFKGVEFVVNERFATTNSLASLALAKDWVRSDFLLLNCDVLAHPALYRMLLREEESTLLYDSSSTLAHEEMKISLQDECLTGISKVMPLATAAGENVGMIRYSAKLIPHLFREVNRLMQQGHEGAWAPMPLNALVKRHRVKCVDVAGQPWIEIDFAHDLKRAKEWLWPLLESSMSLVHGAHRQRGPSLLHVGPNPALCGIGAHPLL